MRSASRTTASFGSSGPAVVLDVALGIVAAACAMLASSCRSAEVSEQPTAPEPTAARPATETPDVAPAAPAGNAYVFVWLRTGPATLEPEASKAAFDGHFANMNRMAAEGDLLLAGPLGEPKARPDDRGVYVFDVATVEAAEALAATDPAVAAGVFVFDGEPLVTSAPLRSLPSVDAEAAATGAEEMRMYVIATALDRGQVEDVFAKLRNEGLVFLEARIGSGETERALCVLDCATADEARELLAYAGGVVDGPEWVLSPWYASKSVELLKSSER